MDEFLDNIDRPKRTRPVEVPAGFTLTQTCGACPEQYDLTRDTDGATVGYFRLRHGAFTVTVPDVGGSLAYFHAFDDDLLGVFPSEKSRAKHLRRGIRESLFAAARGVS